MPKTEILQRLETNRAGFVSGLEKVTSHMEKYSAKLHEGPERYAAFMKGGFQGTLKKDYDAAAQNLAAMEKAIADFQKQVESWKKPGIVQKVKNLVKQKKLDADRETAKTNFNRLTQDLAMLKQGWSTAVQFYKQHPDLR